MTRNTLRSSAQVGFMLLVVAVAAITGWACSCGSGSDHTGSGRSVAAGEGVLTRYHDFDAQDVTLSDKDAAYLSDWLENGNLSFGLLAPQAPGATQPASITGTHEVWLYYVPVGGGFNEIVVPLVADPETAQNLESMFPTGADQQWQALKPANYDWLADVPTQTVAIEHLFGSLKYQLDFHGDDVCNHCQIELTGCTDRQFALGETALLAAFGLDEYTSNDEMTCANPIPTTVIVSDWDGNPIPGPVVLSFGFWGGPVYEPVTTTAVTVPYALRHTASVTLTVELDPIQSEQGWNYHWEDMLGNPVTQVEIGPLQYPLWIHGITPTVQLVGEGLPACARALDNAALSASLALTPTITAETTAPVHLLPDEASCNVADVGVAQTASAGAITAGDVVTFTWAITNFESAPVNVALTATLSSASAVSGVTLPGGCTRNGATITCPALNLTAGGVQTLQIYVQTSPLFNGAWSSLAHVEPVGAVDARFYDNTSGPLTITASGGTGLLKIYLPLVRR